MVYCMHMGMSMFPEGMLDFKVQFDKNSSAAYPV